MNSASRRKARRQKAREVPYNPYLHAKCKRCFDAGYYWSSDDQMFALACQSCELGRSLNQDPPPKVPKAAWSLTTFLWSFLHNCVAHPLLWMTGEAAWATRLHDVTGAHAWPGET